MLRQILLDALAQHLQRFVGHPLDVEAVNDDSRPGEQLGRNVAVRLPHVLADDLDVVPAPHVGQVVVEHVELP
ncbi:hypothetical protein D3C77_718200 [compost metagenome]